jgi:signal transduction histidine kinase
VAAAISTTIASVVLTHVLLTRQFRAQALAEAALAARESLYPLLGAPPSEAHRVLENMRGWPNVTYVALHDASSGRRVAEAGELPGPRAAFVKNSEAPSPMPRLAVETADYCQVVVPLLSAPAMTSFGEPPVNSASQRLGELEMFFSKSALHQLTLRLGVLCSCAGALIASLILLWVARRTRALTVPLARLAAEMEHQDAIGGRATVMGVAEVQQIALTYNRLKARIDEYKEGMERTVEERTREWRRASEAAQQAERAKSALLQASAHELKMPLHLIELQVKNVLHELEFVGPPADPARKALASIVRAANELLSRIVKMLDAARSAGTSHSVPDFVEALRERAEALASAQNDELVVEWRGVALAHSDREKLFEIASELCLNACKFTRDGTVRLMVDVSERTFLIDVIDSGPGIPESERELIWQEFQQGSAGNATYPGQGLGLSMVRQLVDALHGSVVVTSTLGHGTRFQVSIPHVPRGEGCPYIPCLCAAEHKHGHPQC